MHKHEAAFVPEADHFSQRDLPGKDVESSSRTVLRFSANNAAVAFSESSGSSTG